MSSSTKPTRAEVEARLSAAQDSIAGRIQSIEGEVRLPRLASALPGIPHGKQRTLLIAAGVGVVAAWAIFRLTRRRPSTGDAFSEDLSTDIGRFIEDGHELNSAVRRALRRNAPAAGPEPARSGVVGKLAATLLSVGLNEAVRFYFSSGADNAAGGDPV